MHSAYIYVIAVETKEEFAAAVVRFTKSVAERPHKQMVQGHAGGLFSFCADNSATSVKPNAIGEGLLKGMINLTFRVCFDGKRELIE